MLFPHFNWIGFMYFRVIILCSFIFFFTSNVVHASWEKISTSLYESQIYTINLDPGSSNAIYVGAKAVRDGSVIILTVRGNVRSPWFLRNFRQTSS